MAKIYESVTELIGGTPILNAKNFAKQAGANATLLAKLEYFNPAGSVKDRIAKAMIDEAEKSGKLKEGSVIKVPNFYCKKAVFYIDEKTMLPISVSIYDEVSLFESYDFYNLEVNKPIPASEFKKDFKGYGF